MRARIFAIVPLALAGCSHAPPKAAAVPEKAPVAAAAAAAPSAEGTGVDERNLDRSVDPCDDFYRFACGGWMKRNEIPADRSRWGAFGEIEERNLAVLRKTLEKDAAGQGDPVDIYRGKLGDYFAACMDEAAIESKAPSEIAAELAKLDGIKDKPELVAAVAREHLSVANPMFDFDSEQDFKDATQVIAVVDQGGMGMPDRDYYLRSDGKFKEIRERYQAHVQKMFELAGVRGDEAAARAKTVLAIEHALAEGAMDRAEHRNPTNTYHRLDLAGLEKEAPHFPWQLYLKDVGFPEVKAINVAVPGFVRALDKLVVDQPMAAWRVYLAWHLLNGAAPALSKAFVDENFAFHQLLSGAPELPPRWKRCVSAVDHALGQALGQSFVRQTFGEEGKRESHQMIDSVEVAMHGDLQTLPWMDAPTRKEALAKLAAVANQVGYPDRWRNYDSLEVTRGSYLRSMLAANAFETHRRLAKIGLPVDRSDWDMAPQTVNAYYDPSLNEMVFPAGILQTPFFSRAARPSVNYGAIGMVMGHELTHGFDDEGRKFDGQGNLRQWWTPVADADFDKRAQCVVKQYDGYVAVDDVHLNGKLTLGENIADLGGIKLAYHALDAQRAAGKLSAPPAPGHFTDAQLFFLGTAQAWCSKTRPEDARTRVTIDPHSPPEFRVNGPLSNLHEFAEAFSCRPGSRMVRAEQCVIW